MAWLRRGRARAAIIRTFLKEAIAEEARPLQVSKLPANTHIHSAEGMDVTVFQRRLLSFQFRENRVKQALGQMLNETKEAWA